MNSSQITQFAADVACRINEMARDSSSNNAVVIENLLHERLGEQAVVSKRFKIQSVVPPAIEVEIVKCDDNAKIPTCAGNGNAGYDVYSPDFISIPSREYRLIKTGLKCAIPDGYYIRIAGRSSMAMSGVEVLGGVIDSSYRGQIGVILMNHSDTPLAISRGDRIAQFIFEKYHRVMFNEVEFLPDTERGEKGFGSSGK